MLKGTDVSAYQTGAAPKGDFCIVKLTEGTTYVNDKAQQQINSARAQGQLVGYYHYPNFGQNALANAKHFVSELVKYYRTGDAVILDHEYPPSKDVGAAKSAKWGLDFLGEIDKYQPWVYSNISWADDGHCAGMSRYPWWKAWPNSTANFKVHGPFKICVMHQYAETGGIDRDYFYGSKSDWLKLTGTIPVKKEEADMYGGFVPAGVRKTVSFPHGALSAIGVVVDNPEPQAVRIAVHYKAGHGAVTDLTVGGAASSTDTWPKKEVVKVGSDADWFSIENKGSVEIGWDAS